MVDENRVDALGAFTRPTKRAAAYAAALTCLDVDNQQTDQSVRLISSTLKHSITSPTRMS